MPRLFFLIYIVITCQCWAQDLRLGECTTAIFSGAVTSDGRPIIWKNRDVSNFDQRYVYYSSYQRNGITTLPFIGDCYRADTTRIFMGSNSRGFAIMNADSYNLHDTLPYGPDDGTIMRLALESCVLLSDFEAFLDSTNLIGRRDCWNFGCLDSTGVCAYYECANRSYRKYDPQDTALGSPGYLARSNFSISGDSLSQSGSDRYRRAINLIDERLNENKIDINWILKLLSRDLGNVYANPYPLPYHGVQLNGPPGYIYNFGCTIANRSTTSAVVIRGVHPGEDPALTTIFAILGSPLLSLAYPLWVKSGMVPNYLTDPAGAPMYTYCRDRSSQLYDNSSAFYFLNSRYLLDDDSGGVFTYTLPLEAWGIEQAEGLLESWLVESPTVTAVQWEQFRIANAIFTGFRDETSKFVNDNDNPNLPNNPALFNYPNPFNYGTNIVYSGTSANYPVILRIYDIGGRLIAKLNGTGDVVANIYWTGRDTFGNPLASGLYFCHLDNGPFKTTSKMILLK
jgi:hypothetical protein